MLSNQKAMDIKMDKSMIYSVGINYDEGVSRFAGHSEIYEKYLKKFPLQTEFDDMCADMEKGDYESAFRCAHTLKGVAGNLSLNNFYDSIESFVEALRNGHDIELAKRSLPALKELYDKNVSAINAYFGE